MCLQLRKKNDKVQLPKMYLPGDFSFVNDAIVKYALEHDYKNVLPCLKSLQISSVQECFIDGNRNSSDSERPNVWDTPPGVEWSLITNKSYDFHNEKSYHLSMRIMCYIYHNNWEDFIKNKNTFGF